MKASLDEWEAPPVVGAGISWDVSDKLSLNADFRYIFWSESNTTAEFTYTGGDSDLLAAVAGSNTLTIPFLWQDSAVFAIGGSYRLNDIVSLNAGYNYGEVVMDDNNYNYLTPIIY